MSFHAIVHAMLAEGCSAEQIAAAVIALEQSLERDKEARREKLRNGNAERQRRRRAKGKDARHACRGVTERDPFPLKESSPTPPKENNPYPESADFAIDEEDLTFGKAEGLNAGEIQRAVEDMRLWAAEAVGDKALRSDWHATARRFIRRDADARRAGKGSRRRSGRLAKSATSKATVHVKRDTPQGEAWWAHMKATTGRSPPMDKKGGWRFPSEWPPRASNKNSEHL